MATKNQTSRKKAVTKKKKIYQKSGGLNLTNYKQFSRKNVLMFSVIIALIGVASILYSLAATSTTVVQAESLTYGKVATQAVGPQKFAAMYWANKGTGTFNLKDHVTKINVIAKGDQCDGVPKMEIRVDNTIVMTQDVATNITTTYTAAVNIAAGKHALSITFPNDAYKPGTCDRNLYVDAVQFIGIIPDPPKSATTNTAISACSIGVHGIEYGGGTDAARANSVAKMKLTGASTARVNLVWGNVETSRGVYNEARLKLYDDYINKLRASGMHVIVVYGGGTPGWANDPANTYAPRADDFATFAKAMATRYKGKVDSWQILNELDYWWPAANAPTVYTNILKSVYPAIKQADSKATVTLAGLSYDYTRAPKFEKALYVAGAKPYFDQLAMHYYPQPGQDTNLYITNIRQPMVDNGDATKLIVVTETGRPTAKRVDGSVPLGSSSEADQATFMTTNYKTLLSYPYIARSVVYYETFDHDKTGLTEAQNNAEPEYRFGIFRRDNSAKPVLAALQAVEKNCPAVTHSDVPVTLNVAKKQLYELWNASIGEQIFTTDVNERNALISQGYADQGLKGSLYAAPAPGSTPLYSLYSSQITDHFYTADPVKRQQALTGTLPELPGYRYSEQTSPGWIIATPSANNRVFGLTYSARNKDHMNWTADWQKSGQINGGYVDQGIVGYVLN